MNIVFFGTPEFGAVILKKLIAAGLKPALVVTQPDRPAGRKQVLTPPPVKVLAEKYGIPVIQPEHLNSIKFGSNLTELRLKPELFVVASYGEILPKEILELPKHGTLNVHPSLLPKYRGSSPVQETILQGDEETGVTIMLVDEKIDHGPIVAREELPEPIGDMTGEELKAKLANLGGELLVKTIPLWLEGKVRSTPQKEEQATFTKIIKKQDGKIDWNKEAGYIARQVRAFDPWPGTYTTFQGKILKILKAKAQDISKEHSLFPPGSTIPWQKGFAVVTGKGALIIECLQLEGRNPMPAKDFFLGHKDFLGTTLN